MTRLSVTLLLLVFGACSVLDEDLDKIEFNGDGGDDGGGDSDSDSDSDSDTDGDTDSNTGGNTCEVTIFEFFSMEGICQPSDASCEGGINPFNPEGDCMGDGLVCCIDTDQCEMYPALLYCSDLPCDEDGGGPIGCPDNQWCCPFIK